MLIEVLHIAITTEHWNRQFSPNKLLPLYCSEKRNESKQLLYFESTEHVQWSAVSKEHYLSKKKKNPINDSVVILKYPKKKLFRQKWGEWGGVGVSGGLDSYLSYRAAKLIQVKQCNGSYHHPIFTWVIP